MAEEVTDRRQLNAVGLCEPGLGVFKLYSKLRQKSLQGFERGMM